VKSALDIEEIVVTDQHYKPLPEDAERKMFEAEYRFKYRVRADDQYIFQRDARDESLYWNQIVQNRWEGRQLARATSCKGRPATTTNQSINTSGAGL